MTSAHFHLSEVGRAQVWGKYQNFGKKFLMHDQMLCITDILCVETIESKTLQFPLQLELGEGGDHTLMSVYHHPTNEWGCTIIQQGGRGVIFPTIKI